MEEPQEARTPRVEISTILSGSEEGSSPEEERKQLPCGRQSSKSKLLIRSHAIREATSPPPESFRSHSSNEQRSPASACMTPDEDKQPSRSRDDLPCQTDYPPPWKTTRAQVPRFRLKHQGSSQESCSSFLSSISRDPSQESPYTDNTGIDLQQFIMETLHRNQKDRMALLKMEQEMIALAKDPKRTHHKFPPMSSYHRMLVHRVAAYFGLEHNVDQSGNAVIVNKTRGTRIPDPPFREMIQENIPFTDSQTSRKLLLKKDSSSFEDSGTGKSPNHQLSLESRSGKSYEEGSFDRVQTRSFDKNRSWSSCDAGVVEDYCSSSAEQDNYEHYCDEQQLIWRLSSATIGKAKQRQFDLDERTGRLLKVESLDSHELHQLSKLRPAVSKSYSFGGYTGNVSTQLLESEQKQTNQTLLKQDGSSASVSRLSPSSSGYKSSHPSDGSATVSTNTSPTLNAGSKRRLHETRPSKLASDISESQESTEEDVPFVLWAVSSLDSVPEGSVLISPATGKPFLNHDGTVYRYDSRRPLPFQAAFKSMSAVNEEETLNQDSPSAPGFHSLLTSPESFQGQENDRNDPPPSGGPYYQGYLTSPGIFHQGGTFVAVPTVPIASNNPSVRLIDPTTGFSSGYAFVIPGVQKIRQNSASGYVTFGEDKPFGAIQQVGVTPQGGMFCFSAPPNDGMPQQPQVVFPTYSTPVQGHEQPDQQYLHSEGPSQRPVQLPVHGATVHSPGGYIFPGNHGIVAANPFIRSTAAQFRPVIHHLVRPRVPQSVSYHMPGSNGFYYQSPSYIGSQYRNKRPVKQDTTEAKQEHDNPDSPS
ncbi:R3H domain-containing protein 1-like isoform X2 [Artemia franciscana]|uniref:R3H domain-containing protein 1-like isoform X2 n=1 Tax=Artemia franciscana TaxID=6661 RepID=UPI0032DBD7F9